MIAGHGHVLPGAAGAALPAGTAGPQRRAADLAGTDGRGSSAEQRGMADLHLHSVWSDGLASVAEIMEYAQEQTALDVIAIADHDQVGGALEAVAWCARHPAARVRAIVATEISAAWGRHILALFFEPPFPSRPFPRFRRLAETIALVRAAGGIVVVPHPLSPLVPSLGRRTLTRLLGAQVPLEALEVCSGAIGGRRKEPLVRALNAAAWHLAPVGSSDAHHLAQIGSAYTSFPGRSPADLKRAILARATSAHWGPAVRVPLMAHAHQSWRSLVVKPARELWHALAARPESG